MRFAPSLLRSFGTTLQVAAARAPRVELQLEPAGRSAQPQRGDAMEFTVRVRSAPNAAAAGRAAGRATAPGVLICGTRQDDALLHWQRLAVSPAEGWCAAARFTAVVPPAGPMQVVAGVIFEGVCGRDVTKHWSWTPPDAARGSGGGAARRATLPLAPGAAAGAAGAGPSGARAGDKRAAPPPPAAKAAAAAGAAGAAPEPRAPKRPNTIAHAFSFVAGKAAALGGSCREILAKAAPAPPFAAAAADAAEGSDSDSPQPEGLLPRARAAPDGGAATPQPRAEAAAASPSSDSTAAVAAAAYGDLFAGLF